MTRAPSGVFGTGSDEESGEQDKDLSTWRPKENELDAEQFTVEHWARV